MSKITVKARRFIAWILSIVMLFGNANLSVFADNKPENYSNYLNGWKVQVTWIGGNTDYIWDAYGGTKEPKIVTTYRIENAQETYIPGSIKFTIPGIGNINREQLVKSDTFLNGGSLKDWSYVWDQDSDTYIFTNKFQVKQGDSLAGGFEFLYTLNARECVNGFSRKQSPTFEIENNKKIWMEPLNFSFASKKDEYSIALNAKTITPKNYDGLDNSYIWYDFDTEFFQNKKARPVKRAKYYSKLTIPEGTTTDDIKISSVDNLIADGNTITWDQEFTGVPSETSIRIGFKKETFDDNRITISGHLDRLYYDDDEWIKEGSESEKIDTERELVLKNYEFIYNGYEYRHQNQNPYGSAKEKDKLNALSVYNGSVIPFTLTGVVNTQYGSAQTLHAAKMQRMHIATESEAENNINNLQNTTDTITDWDDVYWKDNGLENEKDDAFTDGITYEELYTDDAITLNKATTSNANSDEDEEEDGIWLPDITLFKDLFSKTENILRKITNEITAYANDTTEATPSNAGAQSAAQNKISTQASNMPDKYSMVLGNDKIVAFLKDGNIRNLEDDEYDLVSLTVHGDSSAYYKYDVFAADEQDKFFNKYVLIASSTTMDRNAILLPSGTKAAFVRLNGVKGNYKCDIQLNVRLHVDWNNEKEKNEFEQIDPDNRIIDFSYMRIIQQNTDNVEENVDKSQEDNYRWSYGEELAERDQNLYDEYLHRAASSVYLYGSRTTVDLKTDGFDGSDVSGKDNWRKTVKIRGKLSSDQRKPLERFSLYVTLPEGITFVDDAEIIASITGYTYADGERISGENGDSYISVSTSEKDGLTIITADADFSENSLDIEKDALIELSLSLELTSANRIYYGNNYSLSSYLLLHDANIGKITGNNLSTDNKDLDDDGDTTEIVACDFKKLKLDGKTNEWRESIAGYVKSNYAKEFSNNAIVKICGKTDTERRENLTYQYLLDFNLGSDNAKNIIFFDRLDQGATITTDSDGEEINKDLPSEWQGTLSSIDVSQAVKLGLVSTIYYSTDAKQEFDLNAAGWNTEKPTIDENIKAIAIQFDTSNLQNGILSINHGFAVTLNMLAPTDDKFIEQTAINQFTVQYDGYAVGTETFSKTYTLTSSAMKVKLMDNIGRIVLQNLDGNHSLGINKEGKEQYAALTNGQFQIYTADGTALLGDSGKTTDEFGKIIVKDVRAGTYYWEELKAAPAYKKINGKHAFTVTDGVHTEEILNYQMPGTVILHLGDADAAEFTPIEGARYRLYTSDGIQAFTDKSLSYISNADSNKDKIGIFTTDAEGTITISNLPWGRYYLQQVDAPRGYQADTENKHVFLINRYVYDSKNDNIVVSVYDRSKEILSAIRFTKTDATSGKTLKDAYYNLYKQTQSGNWQSVMENLKTDAVGEIEHKELTFGHYKLKERLAPIGYQVADSAIEFDVSANTSGTTIYLNQEDERLKGSVRAFVEDDDHSLLEGVTLSLFREGSNDPIKENLKTGSNGLTEIIDGLEWGKYYFKQTKIPNGYKSEKDVYPFEITANNVSDCQTVNITDIRIKGSVVLTIYSEDERTLPLQDILLEAHKTDGTLWKGDLRSDANGQVTISGLEWGSYYFQIISVPLGYGIPEGNIRFSVNDKNCTTLQKLTVYVPSAQAQIKINKSINSSYSPFGTPTFIFKISGKDVNGRIKKWIKTLTLNESNKGSIIVSVPAGNYTISEETVSRYKTSEITADINATASEALAITNLVDEKNAEVTFRSNMSQYEKFNEVQNGIGIVNAETKITGFHVEYTGPKILESSTEDRYVFTENDISAYILYDDGSSKEIPFKNLTIDPPEIIADKTATGSGYTVTVSYVENGQRLSDTFNVENHLRSIKPFVVTYDAGNGHFADGEKIHKLTYVLNKTEAAQVYKTDNVNEDGTFNYSYYWNDETIDTSGKGSCTYVAKVKGARKIAVTVYAASNMYYDQDSKSTEYSFASVYQGNTIDPTKENALESVTGKLHRSSWTPSTYILDGDTATIYFYIPDGDAGKHAFYVTVQEVKDPPELVIGELEEPEMDGQDFIGWYYTDNNASVDNRFDIKVQDSDIHVYANYGTATATWDSTLFSTVSGSRLGMPKKEFTSFSRSLTAPIKATRIDDYNVATAESNTPIYVWAEDTEIKWWSKAKTIDVKILSNTFKDWTNLREVDFDGFDTSQTQMMLSVFDNCPSFKNAAIIKTLDLTSVKTIDTFFKNCNFGNVELNDLKFPNLNVCSHFFSQCTFGQLDANGWEMPETGNCLILDQCTASTANFENLTLGNSSSSILSGCVISTVNMPGLTANYINTSYAAMYNCTIEKLIADNWSVDSAMLLYDGSCEKVYARNWIVRSYAYILQRTKDVKLISAAGWDAQDMQHCSGMISANNYITDYVDISGWNLPKLTTSFQNVVLHGARKVNASGWNVGEACTYFSATQNGDIEELDLSNSSWPGVISMSGGAFGNGTHCKKINFSNVNFPKLETTSYAFNGCSQTEEIIFDGFNAPNISNADGMFQECYALKNAGFLQVCNWENLKNAFQMYAKCKALSDKIILSNIYAPKLENMGRMFAESGISSITIDGLDAPVMTDFSGVFYGCKNLKTAKVTNVIIPSVRYIDGGIMVMFYQCDDLQSLDMSNWTANSLTAFPMMMNLPGLKQLNISGFHAESITSIAPGISCSALEKVDMTGWYMPKLHYIASLFSCPSLKEIKGLKDLDTSNVTEMSNVFINCNTFNDWAEISNWNTSKLQKVEYSLFKNCNTLTDLDCLKNWNVSSLTSAKNMFAGCTSLTDASGINDWDISNINNFTNMFFNCQVHPEFSKVQGTWDEDTGTFTPKKAN